MSGAAASKPLIPVAKAAELRGVAPTTAYEWARRDELPGLVKLGNRLYVRRAVLLAWLAGEDVATTPAPVPLRAGQQRTADGSAVQGG